MRIAGLALVGVLLLAVASAGTSAAEFSGSMGVAVTPYFHSAIHPGQERNSGSLFLSPEFYHRWENGPALTFTPFARLDSADDKRTHADIRELNLLWVGDRWEAMLGIGKVFWGVTEFVHLVDIINQTDGVEDIDGEDKLGQPMARFSWLSDVGGFHLFVLPGFRERTFPGKAGRLRTEPPVDTDRAIYESGAEERHVDVALRYSHYFGDVDIGIYHFHGTGREPVLVPGTDDDGTALLVPYYRQIDQTGIDLQMVVGQWLFKIEAIRQAGEGEDFGAVVGGFEYTWPAVGGTLADLGLVGEYAWDERGEDAGTPYADDLLGGLRLTVNNVAGTEILVGISFDLNNQSKNLRMEASHRLNTHWNIELESVLFFDPAKGDSLFDLREDDYLRVSLNYHF